MLDENSIRFIDATVEQLGFIDNTQNEMHIRDIFSTIIGSLEKGDLRSTFLKNLDVSFEYFHKKLNNKVRSHSSTSASSSIHTSSREFQLLTCSDEQLHQVLLNLDETMQLSDVLAMLITNPDTTPVQLIQLLFTVNTSKSSKLSFNSNQEVALEAIIVLFYQRLALHHASWTSAYPVSIACFLSMYKCLHTNLLDDAVYTHILQSNHHILVWIHSFSIYWYSTLSNISYRITSIEMLSHMHHTYTLFSGMKTQAINDVNIETYKAINLLLYYTYITKQEQQQHTIESLDSLYHCLVSMHDLFEYNGLSFLNERGLLCSVNTDLKYIKSKQAFTTWFESSENNCMDAYESILLEVLTKERAHSLGGENKMEDDDYINEGRLGDEDEVEIAYEIGATKGSKSIIDALDAFEVEGQPERDPIAGEEDDTSAKKKKKKSRV